MPDRVQPDPEKLLRRFLLTHPLIAATHGGRVGTALPGTYPAIRITLVSSRPSASTDEFLPELQVECVADDQGVASLLARNTVAAIGDIVGSYPEGACRGHEIVFGPMASPDGTTGRYRYLFDVLLMLYPSLN
jgi:hypothetical protein